MDSVPYPYDPIASAVGSSHEQDCPMLCLPRSDALGIDSQVSAEVVRILEWLHEELRDDARGRTFARPQELLRDLESHRQDVFSYLPPGESTAQQGYDRYFNVTRLAESAHELLSLALVQGYIELRLALQSKHTLSPIEVSLLEEGFAAIAGHLLESTGGHHA